MYIFAQCLVGLNNFRFLNVNFYVMNKSLIEVKSCGDSVGLVSKSDPFLS